MIFSEQDNTNVRWLQIFHLYKVKFNIKGDICRGLLIRTPFKSEIINFIDQIASKTIKNMICS